MKETLLIIGGAGFVGSNLAMLFKKDHPGLKIMALDNLRRRGSDLNLPKLKDAGIDFRHGDIRNPSDLDDIGGFDLLIHCAAEPSVLSGYGTAPAYMNQTNLSGFSICLMLEAIERIKALTGDIIRWDYAPANRNGDHIWWISDIRKFQGDYPDWSYKFDLDAIITGIHDGLSRRMR